jgi:hypothetical protein
MTKAEAEDLGDLLENLGETFSIRYVSSGGEEEFHVIRDSWFAQCRFAECPDPAGNSGQSDRVARRWANRLRARRLELKKRRVVKLGFRGSFTG